MIITSCRSWNTLEQFRRACSSNARKHLFVYLCLSLFFSIGHPDDELAMTVSFLIKGRQVSKNQKIPRPKHFLVVIVTICHRYSGIITSCQTIQTCVSTVLINIYSSICFWFFSLETEKRKNREMHHSAGPHRVHRVHNVYQLVQIWYTPRCCTRQLLRVVGRMQHDGVADIISRSSQSTLHVTVL